MRQQSLALRSPHWRGSQEWTTLVEHAADTNTLVWTPTAQDVYTLSQTDVGNATITLTLPVEVTTNALEVAKTSVVVTDNVGQPLAAQKPSVPAAPNVKVGVAAQRYPWNGMIDVRYKVSNTPAGAYKLKVMADCGGVVFSATVENIKSGIGTAVIQSRGMKEMTSKNCRIYATLQKQN